MHSKHTAAALCAGFAAGIAFIVACSTRTATNRPGLSGNDAAVVRLDGGMRDAHMAHDAAGDVRAVDAGRDAHAQGCTYEYVFAAGGSLETAVNSSGGEDSVYGGSYAKRLPDGWDLVSVDSGGVVLRRCIP